MFAAALLLLSLVATAEPAPRADPVDGSLLLPTVQQLAATGNTEAAAALLDWTLVQGLEIPTSDEVRSLRARLPATQAEVEATMGLAVWQMAAGAYLFGPHLARFTWNPNRASTPYLLGAAAGAALGAGSAIYMGLGPGLDGAQFTTITGSQVLGGFNGAALGALLGQEDGLGAPVGLMVGAGAGTAAGYLLAFQHPQPGLALAAGTGALWGLGLGGAVIIAAEWSDDSQILLPLLIGADVGAVAGFAAGQVWGLSPAAVRSANLGLVAGGGVGLILLGFYNSYDWMEPAPATVLVTGFALAGGATGALLQRHHHKRLAEDLALGSSPPPLQLLPPRPTVVSDGQNSGPGLALLEGRF